MKDAPKRLLLDESQPASLRTALRRTAETAPRPYDAARGLESLKAGIAKGAAGTGLATGGKSALLASRWLWGSLAVTGAATLVAGALILGQGERDEDADVTRKKAVRAVQEEPPPEAPAAVHPTPIAPVEPHETEGPTGPLPQEAPSGATAPSEKVPGQTVAGRRVARPRAEPAQPQETRSEDSDAALRRQIALLAEMRRTLDADPQRVLTLAGEYSAQFGEGMFGEERDALAIFALEHLDRRDEAARRAGAFLEKHPSGPFSEKIRKLENRAAE